MAPTLLDTDILSELLKQKNSNVVQNAAYLAHYGLFSLSALTRYEIRRGLLHKQATAQLARFEVFCQQSQMLPITDVVLDRAADLWVHANAIGQPKADADLMIAATALEHGLVLATGNTLHFAWAPGLIIVDWRQA